MTKRSSSPRLLAFLLWLPLVVLAGTAAWALFSESARVEAELRKEARERARRTVTDLNTSAMSARLESLEALVPEWQFAGAEAPPPGPLAEDYALLLAAKQGTAAQPASPETLEKAKLSLKEAARNGSILTAASVAGLPLMPLAAQVIYGEKECASAVCLAALRQPNELTGRIVAGVLEALPAPLQPWLNQRAARAAELSARLKQGPMASAKTVPEWLDDWHVNAVSGGLVRMLHLEDVRHVLRGGLILPAAEPLVWKPELPAIMGLAAAWHGKPVVEGAGEDLAVEQAGPWRVAITLPSRAALKAESLRRVESLAWILGGAVVATAFALWMAHRAFKKQLELTKLQSEFVASVSHELRTPVASIGVLAERLEEGKADPEQAKQYHRFIAREGRRLAALVNNVLDFSRIERGRKQYDFEHTDLPSLVHETATLLRPAAEEKGLSLTEEFQEVPEEQWPLVDAVAIRQALVNLLENAIKFTPAGGKVTVGFVSANGAVGLRVRDTGIGIPSSDQKKIFERFYRVDNGLRRETNGAGIGLSLVKHIAASHRARVSVDSEVGKYSVFTIQFPRVPIPRQKKEKA
ncbi:MAG TPA: ATP-binding protein [Verrucomicrobiales bacterium]|nr:ATP-binding protein [Verrucomicrobiales bacterium]